MHLFSGHGGMVMDLHPPPFIDEAREEPWEHDQFSYKPTYRGFAQPLADFIQPGADVK